MNSNGQEYHSIRIDKYRCKGCVVCTLACPVQAIRVKDGVADVFRRDLCIDCGECFRVCKYNAVKPLTSSMEDLKGYKITGAIPSTVLYSQFGDQYSPNDILVALKSIGFDYVYDIASTNEEVLTAIDVFLEQNPEIRPMISSYCPPVVRMILKSYPGLVKHIISVDVPREIAAKWLREKIAEKHDIDPEEIGLFHITPCAAKMISIRNPLGVDRSSLDGAIAIHDIYADVLKQLESEIDDAIYQKSSGVGISWAIGKACHRGLPSWKTISVSGIKDVMQILDDIEAGKYRDVDYMDLAVCPGGCVGGPMTVANKHIATNRIEQLIDQYGTISRMNPDKIWKYYEKHYLLDRSKLQLTNPNALDTDFLRALTKMNQIEECLAQLPGKHCGACGSPTCQSLAEDIVHGNATLNDCVFYRLNNLEKQLKALHEPGEKVDETDNSENKGKQ